MRCEECGYENVAAGQTCPCGGTSLKQSRLIPFPVASTSAGEGQCGPPPEWRLEVQERVQAFRARRDITAAIREAATKPPASPVAPKEPAKHTNPILEKALSRLHRAGNNRVKESYLPPRPNGMKEEIGLRIDTLTAGTAILPTLAHLEAVPNSQPEPCPEALLSEVPSFMSEMTCTSEQTAFAGRSTSALHLTGTMEEAPLERFQSADFTVEHPPLLDWDSCNQRLNLGTLLYDDGHRSDCVSRGVQSFGETSGEAPPTQSEPSHEFLLQTAPLSERAKSGVLDFTVILLANVPFWSLVILTNGNLLDTRIQIVLACIAVLIYLFYKTLMLMTAGKTVGMMVTGIVAVDAKTLNLPSFWQAVGRALGSPLAAILSVPKLISSGPDLEARSLSDKLTGTTIQRAFKEIPDMQAPWLYHHRKV